MGQIHFVIASDLQLTALSNAPPILDDKGIPYFDQWDLHPHHDTKMVILFDSIGSVDLVLLQLFGVKALLWHPGDVLTVLDEPVLATVKSRILV